MKVITKQETVIYAINRYIEVNKDHKSASIRNKVKKLAELTFSEMTEENVNKIIGNDTWTSLKCHVSDTEQDSVILITSTEYTSQMQIGEAMLETALKTLRGY